MGRVLVTPTTLATGQGEYLEVLQRAGFEIVFPSRTEQLTEADLLQELPNIDATIAGSEPYTRRVMEASPQLRVIARAGVGFDSVDIAAATEHGVAVTITPGANHDAVAEHTIAFLLALAKELVHQDRTTRQGLWRRQPNAPLRGQTLAIIGLGRIGKAVAVRAAALGMRLIAYEPVPDHDFCAQWHVELVPLDMALEQGDFVTLHLPLTEETRHLIRNETLRLMKPTAFLVNTARGGLVKEADLLPALAQRRIAGAALDVFESEPARSNPLFDLDNVIVTPHTAGVDRQSVADMALQAAQAIVALRRGDWPERQIVNPEVRSRFGWSADARPAAKGR